MISSAASSTPQVPLSRLPLLFGVLVFAFACAPSTAAQSLDVHGSAISAVDSQTGEPAPFGFEPMPPHTPETPRGGELEPTQYLPSGASKSVRSLGGDAFIFQDGGSLATATTAGGGTVLDRYVLPAQPSDMAVEGDLVYVPLRKSEGLMVLDASDPEDLTLVGHLPGRDLLSIAVAGDYAYAGRGLSGLAVYDVSDPAAPSEVSTQASPGSSNGTFVDGSTLYIASGTDGMRTFDLADPAAPAPIGHFDPGSGFASYVVTRDDVAFLTGSFGLVAVDVADPAAPTEIDRFSTGGETTYEIALGEDTAYLPGLDGLRVLDISDPEAITQHALIPASQALSVGFDGADTAFFTERFDGVYALDVSDPAEPAEVAAIQNGGFTTNLTFDGDLLYAVDLAGSLRIIDASGEDAVEISRIAVSGNTQEVDVEGAYAYVTDASTGTGLTVVDISDPASPEVVGSYGSSDPASGLDVVNSTAYVAFGSGGVLALDVADPADPTLLSSFAFGTAASDVIVRDGIAYVTSSGGGMLTLDVSDPADIQQLDHEPDWGFLHAVDLGPEGLEPEPYAYVADGDAGLRVVDISDPADLVTADTSPTSSQARDVAAYPYFEFDYLYTIAYVAEDFYGLREFTIFDEAEDTGSFQSSDRGLGVAVSQTLETDLIALAAGETGVYLFEGPRLVASEDGAAAETFALESAYPNPFPSSTTVRYSLPASADVTLTVYDVLGRRVATLAEGARAAGSHEATFDAASLPSGVYLARLTVGERSETRKLLVVR